jgi:dienelactone hydrolase
MLLLEPTGPRAGVRMYQFEEFSFASHGIRHPVFRHGSGAAVVVLHELAGLSLPTVDLGRRLADAGFTAYLPAFYGRPGQTGMVGGAVRLFCLRRELSLLALDRSSPVADWVRALCHEAHGRSGGPGAGVIGMCLTGGLAMAATIEPSVRAAVSSQPSVPLALPTSGRRRANLGMSPADLRRAADSGTPVLALRFRRDQWSPRVRARAIEAAFGANAEVLEVPERGGYRDACPPIRPLAHSVLTFDLADREGHPTRAALDRVLAFLAAALLEAPGGADGDR